jgi:hypothetical protein
MQDNSMNLTRRRLISLFAAVMMLARMSSVNAEVPAGFTPLFNGKDLTGWKGLVGDPKSRAAMSPEELAKAQAAADQRMNDHWKVVDGELQFDGKGDSLCTISDYGDFEMYVDWKILEGGDSGIYLRGSPQVQIWDTTFEKYKPLGADKGSGALWNNKDNPRFPIVSADKPVGEWNTFYIRMVGERLTVKLNGKLVTDNVIMENYWEKDKPIYPRGQIELQNHGNTLWFRNVFIRELDAKTVSRQDAISPVTEPIALFNGKNLDGFYTWIRGLDYADPNHVFTVKDGMINVSGEGYGGLITRQNYRDYHLVVEFKWGDRTWGDRKDRARDGGILFHCHGADGGYGNTWMASIESQIIEGGVGDLLVLTGKDPVTGKELPTSVVAETAKDRDGEMIWKKGGEKSTVTGGRVNWWGRDVDWDDKIGFRGREDVDSPLGEWTRMDVICDGDHLTYLVNGIVVNEAFQASPSFGKILLQTEQAEMWVRRYELYPIGKAPAFTK